MDIKLQVGDLVMVDVINRHGIIKEIFSRQDIDDVLIDFCNYGAIYSVDNVVFIGRKCNRFAKVGDFVKINYPSNKECNNAIAKVLELTQYTGSTNEGCPTWTDLEVYKDGYKEKADNTWTFPITCLTVYSSNIEEVSKEISKDSTDTSKHYAHSIQPIEYIQQVLKDLPVNPFEGACIKDIIKYCSRYGLKDDKQKEAKKILDYALWLYMESQDMKINPRTDNHEEIYKALFKPQEQPV